MLARLVLSILVVLLAAGVAEAKKVALVIGNGAYQNATPLGNPVNDARSMSVKLQELGFEVVTGFDESHDAMEATVNRFAREAVGADIALLFYAGHGMQVKGENYLIPVDASFKDEAALDFEAIPVDFLIRQMSRDVRLRMIFLDACRDNPLAKTLAASMEKSRSASIGSGLAEIRIGDPGEGTVIAFATSPGDVAYDGKTEHSPFTQALLDHIDAPDLPLQNVLTLVTRDVYQATDKRQRPWFNASVIGEIYLNKTEAQSASTAPTGGDAAAEPLANVRILDADAPENQDPIAWDQEKTLFESAQKSGAVEDFEAYLAAYPKGHFATIARNVIMRSRSAPPEAQREVAAVGDEGSKQRSPLPPAAPPVVNAPEPPPQAKTDAAPPPRPAPAASDLAAVWIEEKGQPAGPLDAAELRRRVGAGSLTPATLVWMNGMAGWQPASGVVAVAGLFGPAAASDPPGGVDPTRTLDPSSYLLGDWSIEQEEEMDGIGPVTVRLDVRYERGGSATASGTIEPRGGPGLPVRLYATWVAEPLGPGRFRFRYEGSMTVYVGAGRPPQRQPIEQVSVVEIVDADTIRVDDGGLQHRVRSSR